MHHLPEMGVLNHLRMQCRWSNRPQQLPPAPPQAEAQVTDLTGVPSLLGPGEGGRERERDEPASPCNAGGPTAFSNSIPGPAPPPAPSAEGPNDPWRLPPLQLQLLLPLFRPMEGLEGFEAAPLEVAPAPAPALDAAGAEPAGPPPRHPPPAPRPALRARPPRAGCPGLVAPRSRRPAPRGRGGRRVVSVVPPPPPSHPYPTAVPSLPAPPFGLEPGEEDPEEEEDGQAGRRLGWGQGGGRVAG